MSAAVDEFHPMEENRDAARNVGEHAGRVELLLEKWGRRFVRNPHPIAGR